MSKDGVDVWWAKMEEHKRRGHKRKDISLANIKENRRLRAERAKFWDQYRTVPKNRLAKEEASWQR